MHCPANAMADKLANHTKTVVFDVGLDSARDVRDTIARCRLSDALVKGFFRYIHQLLRQHATAADSHRFRRIPDKSVINHTDIEADDVTKFQDARPGQSMNDLF